MTSANSFGRCEFLSLRSSKERPRADFYFAVNAYEELGSNESEAPSLRQLSGPNQLTQTGLPINASCKSVCIYTGRQKV